MTSTYATQQTAETIRENVADWTALHTVSDERFAQLEAEYRAEQRLRAIRRYLRERAAR